MPVVTVALLGELELCVDGRIVPVTRPRLRRLLRTLALSPNRVVPFDVLAAQVWAEHESSRSRAGLHTLVSQLRKLVGADRVKTLPHGYLFEVPEDAVDALRFQMLLDSVNDADPVTARPVLLEALELWREGVTAGHAPHLVERYLAAVQRRVDIDLESGAHAELVSELRELTARYPLRETLWAQLMTALYRSGRHAEALDTYQTVREVLAQTLGTNPSAELRRVRSLVLSADNDYPEPVDRAIPRQLPPGIAIFTGRAAELRTLDGVAGRTTVDQPRIAVVHGPGGVGKTALALHWAHGARDRFPDGQIYLDMCGYGPKKPLDPALALDIVLRAVGAHVPRSLEERAALWRTMVFERRMLLFIDNVRDAGQVYPLLPRDSGMFVLVTSRNRLRDLAVGDGVHRLNVGALPVADAVALVRDVIGDDHRSQEPAALRELTGLAGRLPLALVSMAQYVARHPDTSIADLVADVRSGISLLDLLADPDDPTVDPRMVFSWSYRAVDADVARAFRCLGSHPTREITVATASDLLGEPARTTRRLLEELVSVHLLEQDQPGTYWFHDLLQAYATEKARE